METNSIIEQILLTYKLVRGVEDHHVQACFIQADNKSRHLINFIPKPVLIRFSDLN